MNKFAFGLNNSNQSYTERLGTTIFYYGKVTSNIDELGANRIKVRITGVDDALVNSQLTFAFPMLQKFVHIVPKVGETVLVFIPDVKNPFIDRLYLGPIISQPQNLFKESDLFSAKSTLSSGIKGAKVSPDTIPENKGVYPNMDDIALIGRNNSDIILKEKEVIFRAGQFDSKVVTGEIPKFNKVNPSYIQIKHDVTLREKTVNQELKLGGVINIVTNKINLLTHENGSPRFKLNDQENMITDTEMQKIINNAHPLVFGDNLIELIKVFIDAFINHVHAFPGMKPQDLSGANDIDDLLEYNLESILSKNIKIN